MQDTKSMVQKAIQAYKAGQKSQARTLLMQVVDLDEKSEQGWLYLSLVVDSLEEQKICLDNVLEINPNNAQARKAIEVVTKKLIDTGKLTPPSAIIPPPSLDAAPSWGDLSGKSAAASPFGGDWESFMSDAPDASASATSVEWGRDSNTPAFHGSGQNVDPISTQALDSWIQNLNITPSSTGNTMFPPAPTTPSTSAFTSDDFSGLDNLIGQWTTADTPTTTHDSPHNDDGFFTPKTPSPFTDEIVDKQEKPAKPAKSAAPAPAKKPSVFDDDEEDFRSSFIGDEFAMEDEEVEDFFNIDGLLDEAKPTKKPKAMPKIRGAQYFAQIPESIRLEDGEEDLLELSSGGGGGKLSVFILALLNLAAIAGLVMNLTR